MKVPLWVEASKLRVAVFGAGNVGTRRAKFFAEAGAQVTIVALSVSGDAPSDADIIVADLRAMPYERLLKRSHIVVIAVNDQELAKRIAEDAAKAGALINDATNAERTDVVVPYRTRVAGIEIAATSGGAAGAAARLAIDVVQRCVEASHIPTLYEAYSRAKAEAKRAISDVKRRLEFYDALIRDEEFMRMVARGDAEGATRRALQLLKRFAEG